MHIYIGILIYAVILVSERKKIVTNIFLVDVCNSFNSLFFPRKWSFGLKKSQTLRRLSVPSPKTLRSDFIRFTYPITIIFLIIILLFLTLYFYIYLVFNTFNKWHSVMYRKSDSTSIWYR